MFPYRTFLACFLIALVVALAVTPLVIRLARRCGAVDDPMHRKAHRNSTPLWGGLGVFIAMWTPLILLFFYGNTVTRNVRENWLELALIFLGGTVMLLLGAFDDARGVNAPKKFAVQVPLAALLMCIGVQFGSITLPGIGSISLGPLGPLLTLLWLVGITNAINLIDGIDGLAAGAAFFISVANAVIAIVNGHLLLAVVMCALAGALLGFLRYNFNPARVFLGDAGSLFLGMTLAVTSVLGSAKGTVAASLLVPLAALGYPVMDTFVAMARRAMRGKPLFTGDKSHLHHRLISRGLNQRQAALALYGLCILFCLVAVAMVLEHHVAIGIVLVILLGVLALLGHYLGYTRAVVRLLRDPRSRQVRNQFQFAHHDCEALKARVELARNLDDLRVLLRRACDEFELSGFELTAPDQKETETYRPEVETGHRRAELPSGTLRSEPYTFADTGLRIRVLYRDNGDPDGLLMEHRMRMGEVIEAVNGRILHLARDGNETPPTPVSGAPHPVTSAP